VILDLVRTTLHTAITTPKGDSFTAVRVPKDFARRLNITFGSPICSAAELEKRKNARVRLAKLRTSPVKAAVVREAAPVMVYFEKDRNARELGRVEDLLKAKGIEYQRLDVAGDEATMAFVTRAAGCKEDDLPVVFVAGSSIGTYPRLVEADVSGELASAIYGA
jgi:glutaredoxin